MKMDRTRAATVGLLVPAALALGMSADTSLRFLEDTLKITNEYERWALCGTVEAAIIALTVYAWATRTKGPAYLAYMAVLIQAVPAFTVGGGAGGVFRVVAGPVMLAILLHLLLGLEIRMSGARSDGILGAALREVRERLTAFLGIGRRGADSAAIARSRAADRAVALADRVAGAKQGSRKHSRLSARLAAAIDAARHGLDGTEADAAEAAIVSRVVRRKSVASLADIPVRHDWTAALTTTRRDTARDTETGVVPSVRDTDRDTATSDTTDRAMDKVNGSHAEEVPAASAPAPVVPLRQSTTSRRQGSDQRRNGVHVAGDTTATAPAPIPESVPSVAQMVREALQAGITDRDVIVSRVQQYRPGTPRATVSKAIQRHGDKYRDSRDTGQYL